MPFRLLGLLIPGWVKFAALGLAAIAIGGVMLAGYLYVKGLQADNAQLTANLAVREVEAAHLRATVVSLTDAVKARDERARAFQADVDRLAASAARHRREASDLATKLAAHDLHRLATAKPTLITRRINDATAEMLIKLMEASGATPAPDPAP